MALLPINISNGGNIRWEKELKLEPPLRGGGNSNEWKLAASGIASTGVSLPTEEYSEIMVEVHRTNTNLALGDAYNYNIPRNSFEGVTTSKVYYPQQTYYPNNNVNEITGLFHIIVDVQNNKLTAFVNSGGNDVSSSSGLWLYYR